MVQKKLIRWPYVIYGMILFIFLGIVYAWSLFAAPLEAEYGWTRADTSMVYTISMSFFAIGNILGGFTANKRPLRFNILISAMCLLVGFVSSSFVKEVWHLCITYGVLAGFASGFTYTPTISTIVKWYPDRPGMASGLLLLAFGLSTIVIGTPIASLFRIIGISRTFFGIGIVFSAAMAIVSFFVAEPSADIVFPEAKADQQRSIRPLEDITTSQVIRRPSLWLFLLWSFGLITAGYAVIGHAATSVAAVGASVLVGTAATSGLALANGLSRVLWGVLCDRLGLVKVRFIIHFVMLTGFALSIIAFRFNSAFLLIAGLLIIGAAYGGAVAYAPSFIREMYGTTFYASNYSLFYVMGVPNAIVGSLLMSNIYAAKGSYIAGYSVIAVLVLGCLVFAFFIRMPGRE